MSEIIESIESFFDSVFNWLYELLFVDSFDVVSSLGYRVFNSFYSFISSSLSTGDFLYILIGFCVFFALIRLLISIIRG